MNTTRYLEGLSDYQQIRQDHWDDVARSLPNWKGWGNYYHQRLENLFQLIIPNNQKVLEVGSGDGKLLHSLSPSLGVGIDFSSDMCTHSKKNYPNLSIVQADAHYIPVDGKFDYIILSDLLNDLWDVQQVLSQLQDLCHSRTRVIINGYSKLWELPLALGQLLKFAKPNLPQNWLTPLDIERLLMLENFEVIKKDQEIIFPFSIPLVTPLLNKFVGKIWPFKNMALTNVIIGRPLNFSKSTPSRSSVSVIIPARNEAGNIEALFNRVPEMGSRTELIFIEGHSQDDTFEKINEMLLKYPDREAKLFQQEGNGKGDAVRLGFNKATGDILMILDSDLSVPPEDLVLFYNALEENKGDFINGVRLIYPMEDEAMRFLNLLGNKFFSVTFSWLLGQPIKDTLCGTKVLRKKDYQTITHNRSYFGDFDPFGDFDLLFGAAKLNLKIVEIPIRYRSRTYGSTNIHRFRHGWLLLRMVLFAANKLKFI